MKKPVFSLLLLLVICELAVSQSYKNPESIAYDATGKRYFISNKGGNTIVQLDSLSQLTNFVTSGLKNPKGLLIVGDTLISVNNTTVQGFLLSNASLVLNVSVSGSSWMNDVTNDGKGYLYVSDTETNKVHKISMKTGEYSTLVSVSGGPNGLFYDKQNNSLFICNSGSNAKIFSYNLTTSTLSTLVTTKFSDLDGLARDNCGNVYVSSWGSNSVYVYDSLFENPPTQLSKGHNGPADISIYDQGQILAVPNFNANTVQFISLNKGCATITHLSPQNNSIGADDSLLADWEDISGVSTFEVEYSTDSIFTSSVKTVQTSSSSATLTGLSFKTKYYWRVRPIDGNVKPVFGSVWNFTTKGSSSKGQVGAVSDCVVFPNPAKGAIHVEWTVLQPKEFYYTLSDFSGKIVKQGTIGSQTIDVSGLENGLYLLIMSTNETVIKKKVVIEN